MMSRLRVFVVCMALEMGVLSGVPMRPDEIRQLMNQMNQPKLAHALPSGNDEGNDVPPDLVHSLLTDVPPALAPATPRPERFARQAWDRFWTEGSECPLRS